MTEAQTACLMQGMADKLGVEGAIGALPVAQMDKMVTTCRACTRADDCILWMVEHSTGAATTPDYCLNGEYLELMRNTG